MRILVLAAFAIFPALMWASDQQHVKQGVDQACRGNDRPQLTDSYFKAVLDHIQPPEWEHWLIRITLGKEKKLVLLTDGKKFELDTDVPEARVYDFLMHLDETCQLPKNPADAFNLMKIKWERSELSPAQFAQLHREFTTALLQDVTAIQESYDSLISGQMYGVYVDAVRPSIEYEFSRMQIGIDVWDVPEGHKMDHMVDWVHKLQSLGEEKFHRPFGHK